MFKFDLNHQDTSSKARLGTFHTPHGSIQTPIFMPVGTLGSVKGVSPQELKDIQAQIILANTYHLYLRPGHELVQKMGGLHKWMNWDKPILTDSGGFQVFSLGKGIKTGKPYMKVTDEGVQFKSHLNGSKHFFSPEKVIEIEQALGADIIMQLDECAPHDSSKQYAEQALKRTHDWAERCLKKHQEMEEEKAQNPQINNNVTANPQALFPIIQGTMFEDLRIQSAQFLGNLPTPGIAIGGLSVGEERSVMYNILDVLEPHLPAHKPRYLMGVGTPPDLLEGIARGIDMFDCVHATRIARHGCFYNKLGRQQIKNEIYKDDPLPLDPEDLNSPVAGFSRSYLRHLLHENEMLGMRILSIHNLYFLLRLMQDSREAIANNSFLQFKNDFLKNFHTEG
jgi:queuine tRNA-ribosyltransferase